MPTPLNRRNALGAGLGAAAAAALLNGRPAAAEDATATTEPPAPDTGDARRRVAAIYRREAAKAGGVWNSMVSIAESDGTPRPAIEDKANDLVEAYSVNKVPVAVAVLDKVDRGLLTLDQRVEVTSGIVIPAGDGIFRLDGGYPSSVTIGHALAALLTVSDDTAVRLCGLVAPALEINQILTNKGYPKTQVVPVANPHRFFLGRTTPKEMHDMLQSLVKGTLLSAPSTDYLLNTLRSPIAFTDGIRRTMSSDERLRIATKAGWFDNGRNEAGVMFDRTGRPMLCYALFAHGLAEPDNFGPTHPALKARDVMGRRFLDVIDRLSAPGAKAARKVEYKPANGG